MFFPFSLDTTNLQHNPCTNILASTLLPINFTTTTTTTNYYPNTNTSNIINQSKKCSKKSTNKAAALHQCRICFRSVQSKGSLNRHYRQTHGFSFEDIQKLYNKLQQHNQQEQQDQNISGLLTAANGNDAADSVTNLFSLSSNINEDLVLQNGTQTVTYNPLCMLEAQQENVFIIDEYLDDSVDFRDLNEC